MDYFESIPGYLFFNIIFMLYLFGCGEYGTRRTFLKVGYTDDLDTRIKQYKLHNPGGKMIDTREGDEMLELKLHLRLTYHKEDFLDEWLYDEPEVKEIFKQSEEEIDKWLWDNRMDILQYPVIPLPGTKKRKILDSLRKKFKQSTIEGTKLL